MHKPTTFEEALQDPAHQDMWEVIRFLENHEGDILFPEKFLASHKDAVLRKIQRLQVQSPALSLKDALFEILNDIPENVPAHLLIELTRFAIEEWEARPATFAQKKS
jgi:hypothetical protein